MRERAWRIWGEERWIRSGMGNYVRLYGWMEEVSFYKGAWGMWEIYKTSKLSSSMTF